MKKGLMIFNVSMIFLLILSIFLYVRDYYEGIDEAKEAMREGNYEFAEEMIDYAHRSIRNLFITLLFWVPIMYSINHYYRKRERSKKEEERTS